MKSIIYAAFISFLLLISANAEGQNGHIYTVAGVLTGGGYMGDGGPANEAQLYAPIAICLDAHNNLYIADFSNSRVRKVDAVTHIITTVAGNGVMAYTGDGGPATDASIHFPHGVCCDAAGNLYIADYGNDVVRMVSPTGIISTFAGTGTLGYSGDGGPATAASPRPR